MCGWSERKEEEDKMVEQLSSNFVQDVSFDDVNVARRVVVAWRTGELRNGLK